MQFAVTAAFSEDAHFHAVARQCMAGILFMDSDTHAFIRIHKAASAVGAGECALSRVGNTSKQDAAFAVLSDVALLKQFVENVHTEHA